MEVCVVDGLLNFKRTFTRSTMYMILRFVFRPGVYRTDTFFCDSLQKPRADPDGGATRAIVSPKICGSIFFHNEFVQFAGHYLQYKDILPSIVLSQQCCEVFRSEVPSGYAQSFAPWQQATIEIMLAISLTIACSRNIYDGVTLHAHPVRGESHNQRNTTGEVATSSPPFYNKPHRSHVLCAKAELGTTSTSWSQHHFIAIGNPERHARKASHRGSKQQQRSCSQSLFLLLVRVAYKWCYSSRTSRWR